MSQSIDETLIHPCTAINLLSTAADNVGIAKIVQERFYEKTREAWIGAVFLLALKRYENATWWLKANPVKHETPDLLGYKFIEEKPGLVVRYVRNIEVFRWVKRSPNTLLEQVKAKLNKSYPENYTLVCYIMREGSLNFMEIYSQLKKLSPKILDIWLIGSIRDQPEREMIVGQVWPKPLVGKIDIDKDCENIKEPKFIVPYLGLKKDRPMYERLGRSAILRTDFILEEIKDEKRF